MKRRKLPPYVRRASEYASKYDQKEPPKLYYSIKEAAAAMGVGRSSIYKALRAGTLTARKFGKRTLIAAEDVDKYLYRLPFWTRLPPENRNPWG